MGWKAAQKLIQNWKILRGDNVISFCQIFVNQNLEMKYVFNSSTDTQVIITRGKDRGETGLIKRVIRSQNRVIVEGKNLVSYFHWDHYALLGITLPEYLV